MIINGFDTRTLSQSVVTDFGKIQSAIPRYTQSLKLYGANGTLNIPENSFDGYERTFEFFLKHYGDVERLIESFVDLRNELEFGYQLGSLFYADLSDTEIEPWGGHDWKVTVKVYMYPFRYEKDVSDVVLTSNGTVTNTGTVYSEPVLIIEGNGECSVTIGAQTMVLTVTGKATVDCRHLKQNIYDQNGKVKNTLRKRGPFFEIPVGRVGVSLSSTVKKLTIKGNWRYRV